VAGPRQSEQLRAGQADCSWDGFGSVPTTGCIFSCGRTCCARLPMGDGATEQVEARDRQIKALKCRLTFLTSHVGFDRLPCVSCPINSWTVCCLGYGSGTKDRGSGYRSLFGVSPGGSTAGYVLQYTAPVWLTVPPSLLTYCDQDQLLIT